MAHATPGASPHPRRPSLSPLAVKDWPGAARSTTLTDATDLHGRKAAHALPLPRRAFSDEVVVLASTAAQGPLRRKDSFVEDWRLSVSPPVYDLDSCVEHLGLSPRSLNEPSSSDSGLFSEKRSVAGAQILRPPAAGDVHRTASFGQGEGAHFLASEWSLSFDGRRDSPFDVDDFTDSFSPGGLEVDFGGRRGRRASRGMDDGESMSRSGVARTAASRRVLSVGKTGPSLGLQTESAVSSPSSPRCRELALVDSSLASSSSHPVSTRARSQTVLSDSAATSRRRSIASESLARLVSDSPTSSTSPPSHPTRPHRRRHSSYTRLNEEADDCRTVTATPYPNSSASPSPSHSSPTLTTSLSRYQSSGRRGSHAGTPETSATGSGAATPAAHRDLRKPPPSSALHALTSSLAFFPAFPFPGQKKAAEAPEVPEEGETRLVPWSSIKALYVCFKPSSASLASSDEDAATSDIVNAWLVGLQELSVGGSRPWDPRLLCPEPPSPPFSSTSDSLTDSPPLDTVSSSASTPSLTSSSPSSSEESPSSPRPSNRKGGRRRSTEGEWPSVTTLVSCPPAVWVERKDGGWREFDPKGMGVDEIMRNVLLVPSTGV